MNDTTLPLEQQVDKLVARASRFVAPGRIDALLRQWCKGNGAPVVAPMATALASTLALVTHATNGTNAFDRMARAGGHASEALGVLTGLRKAQYRIIQQSGGTWRDVVTNETLPIRPKKRAQSSIGAPLLCVVAPMPDGSAVVVGVPVPLDPAAMAVARPFIHPGARGLSNPVHCAELVYRHVLQAGVERTVPEPKPEPRRLPFRPEFDPIDALAAAWAERLDRLTEQDLAKARLHTGLSSLINVLTLSNIARDAGLPRLADAYARIALVIIETFMLRHRHGSGSMSLDRLATEIAATVAERGLTPRIEALFATLRDRAKIAPAAGRASDSDLDKLVQRIRGLRDKTVDRGCTEHEAMAAAEKVAELLDRYGLSLNELDLRRQTCEGVGIETGRKRRGPIDGCMHSIAVFFDCRVWSETPAFGTLRYIFFGLPGDVEAAVYLHDLVAMAFETETIRFQAGDLYGASTERRTATHSFQIGLAAGISAKLNSLRTARDSTRQGASGRDLVPVKQSIIEGDLEKLGLRFKKRSGSGPRLGARDAFDAGQEAGERFDYRPGIKGGRA